LLEGWLKVAPRLPRGARALRRLLRRLHQLGDALGRGKRVTFTYHTMGSDTTSERTVEPLGLFFLNQHWHRATRGAGEDTVKN
jgi:hypothetical protein